MKYFQNFQNNKPIQVNTIPFFSDLEIGPVVHNIEKLGYAKGLNLSEKYVVKIAKCFEDTKDKFYLNPHNTNKGIWDIAHNSKIIEIARKYLGVEPILNLSGIT